MIDSDFKISEISLDDKDLVSKLISNHWGSIFVISKGYKHNAAELPGFICRRNNDMVGLITYNISDNECEIVTLNCEINNKGIVTELINKVIKIAKLNNCRKVWLVTTNDNINAIKFYQKWGFEWIGFHKDAIQESRKLKPEIPELGIDNIPIKHEIEFEYKL